MDEFSAGWLALREPADAAARSLELTRAIGERLRSTADRRVIVDLATGTGANFRFLADRLPSPQCWRLADRDPDLLEHVLPRISAWATSRGGILSGNPARLTIRGPGLTCDLDVRRVDLSRLDEDVVVVEPARRRRLRRPRQGDALACNALFAGCVLVTASALLDLVSAHWLDALAIRCRRAGAAVLFALTYDGRWSCTPKHPEDERVRALVNRHQHSMKGFGKALGPDAAGYARQALTAVDYQVESARSDWLLSSTEDALQRQLVEGWASAAAATEPAHAGAIERWKTERLARIAEGVSQVSVGHVDLAAWPR